MKRLAVILAVLSVCLASVASAAAEPGVAYAPAQNGYVTSAPKVLPWAPDRVLVQLTSAAVASAPALARTAKASGPVTATGLADVDAVLANYQVKNIAHAFGDPYDKTASAGPVLDRWFRVDLAGAADVQALVAELSARADVEEALLDMRAFPSAVPDDPMYPDNWGHNNTAQLPDVDWGGTYGHTLSTTVGTPGFDANAQLAWDGSQGYGGSSVVIAIVDTGVDTSHPDLSLTTGYDFGDNDSNPTDDSAGGGHGTCCAGVAAGVADNALGVAGAAGNCTVMPLKVADSAGNLYFDAIINAVNYAASHGADVISMSFGTNSFDTYSPMDTAVQNAFNAGVVLLAATGNENASSISYPACSTDVIAVGAASPCGDRKRSSSNHADLNPGVNADPNGYTCDGERWWGSNYGLNTQDDRHAVDVIAPTILPTTDITGSGGYDPGDYDSFFNGTSCATPYAAGVCALIKSANPGWNASQIRDQLRSTAQDIVNVESVAGWDRYSGYGMVDAAAAVGVSGPTPPTAAFSATPTAGCAPQLVSFTDDSTGAIDTWGWDFGDGGTDTVQNPTHTYTAAGSYDVTLIVGGTAGADTLTRVAYVTIGEGPAAGFTADPLSGVAPLQVAFTDTSAGADSWSWDFGDGGTDTVANPLHTYTAAGTYTVTQIATNACGADTSVVADMITVAEPPPVAAFSGTPTAGCAPLAVTFTDESTGAVSSWQWDFGDGGISADQNPAHTYTAAGAYDVTLIATGSGGADTLSVAGYVTADPGPVANFSASDSTGTAPLSVTFTDLSANATGWQWDFGDGGADTAQNPVHVYADAGVFTVRLIATGACGADTLTAADLITVDAVPPPTAAFSGTPTTGCAPLDVTFADESTGTVSSWQWDFGDGGASTDQNPVHTYAAAGSFDVTLIATGAGGADTLTVAGYVTADPGPIANFSASDSTGTAPLSVAFTDLSANADGWQWDFGDGGTDVVQNPVHVYTDAGVFTVRLIATGTCGADTLTAVDVIAVDALPPPTAAFTPTPTSGCAPLDVTFTDQSTGAIDAWAWTFGDGGTSTEQNPTHRYASPGAYDVRLIVTNAGGADTLTVAGAIQVAAPVAAAFAIGDTVSTRPFEVTFLDQSTGGPTHWSWDFGDGATDTLQSPAHAYPVAGSYDVTLIVANGCSADTLTVVGAVVVDSSTGVDGRVPAGFGLAQNYPNPFNPSTTIAFALGREGRARLEVYDTAGRRIAVLMDKICAAGEHSVVWQPRNVSSGVYFARFSAEGRSEIRRMVLLK